MNFFNNILITPDNIYINILNILIKSNKEFVDFNAASKIKKIWPTNNFSEKDQYNLYNKIIKSIYINPILYKTFISAMTSENNKSVICEYIIKNLTTTDCIKLTETLEKIIDLCGNSSLYAFIARLKLAAKCIGNFDYIQMYNVLVDIFHITDGFAFSTDNNILRYNVENILSLENEEENRIEICNNIHLLYKPFHKDSTSRIQILTFLETAIKTQENLLKFYSTISPTDENVKILGYINNLNEGLKKNKKTIEYYNILTPIHINNEEISIFRKIDEILEKMTNENELDQKKAIQNFAHNIKIRCENSQTPDTSGLLALEWLKKIPEIRPGLSGITKQINHINCEEVRKTFKEKIFEQNNICDQLINHLLSPSNPPKPVLLVGPPGTGKTTIAQYFAELTKRKCFKIDMNTIDKDDRLVSGSIGVYVGAEPGLLIQKILNNSKEEDILIIFDEIDKANGIVQNELLQVLDVNNNNKIACKYFSDVTFNMQNIMIICLSNDSEKLTEPIQDRLATINIEEFSVRKKYNYIKWYWEKAKPNIKLTEKTIYYLVTDTKTNNDDTTYDKIIKSITNIANKILAGNRNNSEKIDNNCKSIRDIQKNINLLINYCNSEINTTEITDQLAQRIIDKNYYQIKSWYDNNYIIIDLWMHKNIILFTYNNNKGYFWHNENSLRLLFNINEKYTYYLYIINENGSIICNNKGQSDEVHDKPIDILWNNMKKNQDQKPLQSHIKNTMESLENNSWYFQILITTKN